MRRLEGARVLQAAGRKSRQYSGPDPRRAKPRPGPGRAYRRRQIEHCSCIHCASRACGILAPALRNLRRCLRRCFEACARIPRAPKVACAERAEGHAPLSHPSRPALSLSGSIRHPPRAARSPQAPGRARARLPAWAARGRRRRCKPDVRARTAGEMQWHTCTSARRQLYQLQRRIRTPECALRVRRHGVSRRQQVCRINARQHLRLRCFNTRRRLPASLEMATLAALGNLVPSCHARAGPSGYGGRGAKRLIRRRAQIST
jgi:hypothetical protein